MMNFGGNNNNPPQPMGGGGVINLSKGAKIDLSKEVPNLTRAMIGLGWKPQTMVGQEFDLDASVFLLDVNDRARGEQDFIFYNQPKGINDCVVHHGDNLTGTGNGDDEQIFIDFTRVPNEINKIVIAVTIHDADARRQNFGQVKDAFVRVVDENGVEKIRYDLGEDFSTETAIIVCEFYKHNGSWRMSAVGSGYAGGLAAIATSYGLNVK